MCASVYVCVVCEIRIIGDLFRLLSNLTVLPSSSGPPHSKLYLCSAFFFVYKSQNEFRIIAYIQNYRYVCKYERVAKA